MVSAKQFAIAGVAAVGLVQFCPAPFLAAMTAVEVMTTVSGVVGAIAGLAGGGAAVASAVSDAKGKRKRSEGEVDFFSRINKRQEMNAAAVESCHQQLGSATVGFQSQGTGTGNVLVTGIPSSCMTLLTVITGKYNEGNPVPMGSDSALFQNLSDESLQELIDALNAHA
ncbi:hypothetical protein HII31_11051 [Pseudocercospora fuligena]|uniref:Uncharacterized protein n=1 Tax=Pseudocercospora fuligena TaxID=685502 RepID=A0A8H6RBW9_9PEZI|nr:hypothetical protein HII31_11051 [Pseudocercospora fuligena]